MKKTVFTMTIILGLTILSAKAQLIPAFTARLQDVFDSTCTKLNIKGASAAVYVPNGGIWKGVHGESYSGQPITPGMLFNIGSNTKTYTATTMLLLQEQGLVSLDDTIGAWIKNQPNINGQIKIRQLLNHTSGIYSFTDNPGLNDSLLANPFRIWKPTEVLSMVLKPLFKPGANWSYSNTNYIIAGIIIEKITGKTFDKAIHDLLFVPQGFDHTIFWPENTTTDTITHNWATGLTGGVNLTDADATPGWSNAAFFSMASTAGGIMTTAEENAEFWHKLIGREILSEASMHEMLDYIYIGRGPTNMPVGYGLGIFRYVGAFNGHTAWEHGGTNFGYIAENMVDSVTGICFSVLTNQDSISNDDILSNVIAPMQKLTLTMKVAGIEQAGSYHPAIRIYPNPANDIVHISVDNLQGVAKFQLTDLNGKMIMQSDIHEGTHALQVSQLKPGLYIVSITSEKGEFVYSQKINVVK